MPKVSIHNFDTVHSIIVSGGYSGPTTIGPQTVQSFTVPDDPMVSLFVQRVDPFDPVNVRISGDPLEHLRANYNGHWVKVSSGSISLYDVPPLPGGIHLNRLPAWGRKRRGK